MSLLANNGISKNTIGIQCSLRKLREYIVYSSVNIPRLNIYIHMISLGV